MTSIGIGDLVGRSGPQAASREILRWVEASESLGS